ncbi:hypothetical protein C8J57DRAFT_1533505 [Mycena rebaudengoi]|nr:hypothetical protein C8J57DRAFT_1533505 [Mycena rebaudengoi]
MISASLPTDSCAKRASRAPDARHHLHTLRARFVAPFDARVRLVALVAQDSQHCLWCVPPSAYSPAQAVTILPAGTTSAGLRLRARRWRYGLEEALSSARMVLLHDSLMLHGSSAPSARPICARSAPRLSLAVRAMRGLARLCSPARASSHERWDPPRLSVAPTRCLRLMLVSFLVRATRAHYFATRRALPSGISCWRCWMMWLCGTDSHCVVLSRLSGLDLARVCTMYALVAWV